jgi:hypothetical protein
MYYVPLSKIAGLELERAYSLPTVLELTAAHVDKARGGCPANRSHRALPW